MRYDQLEHAIRAACAVSGDTEVLIFGSQAILGTYPQAPEPLRASIEVDLQPKNKEEQTVYVDGALGEGSRFHETHGFYVHGISIDAATLPADWDNRTVRVCDDYNTRGCIGYCLEAHDLAASKLVAFRDKDREFVIVLLNENLIDPLTLLERISGLPVSAEVRGRLRKWVEVLLEDLG